VAGYDRVVVRPRVARAGPRGDVFATAGLTAEDGGGGTLGGAALRPTGAPFALARATRRADAGVVARAYGAGGRVLAARASATGEWRRLDAGALRERGRRETLFAEGTLTLPAGPQQEWVLGAAVQRDAYAPRARPDPSPGAPAGFALAAPAVFAQHTWTPGGAAGRVGVAASARLDRPGAVRRGAQPAPLGVVRPGGGVTARASAGLGTFAPTPFVEEAEEVGVSRVLGADGLRAERARTAQVDVGWARGGLELNAAAYTSAVRGAVAARGVPDPLADPRGEGAARNFLLLDNAANPMRAAGTQLFGRYRAGPYRVTGTYEFQRATEDDPERLGRRRGVPLTPRHTAGLVAGWEREGGDGIGVEAYYTGRQPLADDPYRAAGRPFVTLGVLARRRVGRALVFVNGENLGNVRQTRVAPLVRPAAGPGGRWTTDAWAPLEGAVVNAGVRLTLGGGGR
jgi:iron complex outermembrane receptor protein